MYQSVRKTTKIEIGAHQGQVGYTMYFDNGEKEHYLFAIPVAKSLVTGLSKLIKDFEDRLESAKSIIVEHTKVMDTAEIKIKDSEENKKNG